MSKEELLALATRTIANEAEATLWTDLVYGDSITMFSLDEEPIEAQLKEIIKGDPDTLNTRLADHAIKIKKRSGRVTKANCEKMVKMIESMFLEIREEREKAKDIQIIEPKFKKFSRNSMHSIPQRPSPESQAEDALQPSEMIHDLQKKVSYEEEKNEPV
jgi:hypothetical protein